MPRVHHRHRARILSRDGFKCFICPAVVDLDIHHIIPQFKGGKTTDENLVSLCEFCHKMLAKQMRTLVNAKFSTNGSSTFAEYWEKIRQMQEIEPRRGVPRNSR